MGFTLKQIGNLLGRRFHESVEGCCAHGKPTGMQGLVISYLAQNADRDVFQRDIESEFRVRRSTATGILKLMEKNGLVARKPVDYDARLKKLELTEKAAELCEHIKTEFIKLEALLTRGVTDEELAAFYAVTDKIKANLEGESKA